MGNFLSRKTLLSTMAAMGQYKMVFGERKESTTTLASPSNQQQEELNDLEAEEIADNMAMASTNSGSEDWIFSECQKKMLSVTDHTGYHRNLLTDGSIDRELQPVRRKRDPRGHAGTRLTERGD